MQQHSHRGPMATAPPWRLGCHSHVTTGCLLPRSPPLCEAEAPHGGEGEGTDDVLLLHRLGGALHAGAHPAKHISAVFIGNMGQEQ